MQCKKIRRDILSWVNGELSARREKGMSKHIEECELCRQEVEMVKKGDRGIRSITREIEQEETYLTSERLLNMETELKSPPRIWSFYRLGSIAATAAAVIIALLFVPSFLSSPDTSPEDQNVEAAKEVQASLSDDNSARQDTRSIKSNSGWKIRLVDEQGNSSTVRGHMRPPDVQHSSLGERRVSMYNNNDNDVDIPVEQDLYDAESDGYWW